jgi:hypothetical protein
MNYSLGNMLGGAGALNADKLSLNLQFAADKTLTARRGPTPTFTRASTATFVGSDGLIQSAAINQARFDHDPVTLACKGLLIEESRTNLLLRSEEFDNASWTKVNGAITINQAIAPSGATAADLFIPNVGTALPYIQQNGATTISTVYTWSVYLKAAGYSWVFMDAFDGSNHRTWFNLTTGTIGTVESGNTSTITPVGNDWYRCTLTRSVASTNPACAVAAVSGNNGLNISANGTSGLYLWGAQLEAGSFATSYIPTTTASVVRSADVCSITGSAFTGMFNGTEGTLFASFYTYGSSGFGAVVTADPSSDQGKIQIAKISPTQADLSIKDAANNVVFAYSPASSLTTGLNKSALAYKSNDSIATVNNFSSALDTSVTLWTQTRLAIGNDSVGSGRRINGSIASIRVYKKRLSLAKLQALTV